MKTFNFNGESFYLDLDEIFDLLGTSGEISDKKNSPRYHSQKEISNSYELNEEDNELGLSQKVVHEILTEKDEMDAEKYLFVKMLIETLLDSEDTEINEDTSFSIKLIFNTLLNKKIIKTLKEDE